MLPTSIPLYSLFTSYTQQSLHRKEVRNKFGKKPSHNNANKFVIGDTTHVLPRLWGVEIVSDPKKISDHT